MAVKSKNDNGDNITLSEVASLLYEQQQPTSNSIASFVFHSPCIELQPENA